jgi:hypothetical protein
VSDKSGSTEKGLERVLSSRQARSRWSNGREYPYRKNGLAERKSAALVGEVDERLRVREGKMDGEMLRFYGVAMKN